MGFAPQFFEATAQLIPVLFLALIVEERLKPEEEEAPDDRVIRSWLIVLVVLGEVLSLAVVAGGIGPSKGAGSIVTSAMVMMAFLISVPAIHKELKADRSQLERLGHASAGVAVIAVVLVTLLAVQLS